MTRASWRRGWRRSSRGVGRVASLASWRQSSRWSVVAWRRVVVRRSFVVVVVASRR
ncbi:hypothetical protein ACXZ9C_11630 [Streptococcus agalactiae]